MKERLPAYIVKCFIATGFDTLEVIAEMDVGSEAGNSIEQIEQFICNEYPDNPEYERGKKFPPGHRIRIQKFVSDVKQTLSKKTSIKSRKRPLGGGVKSAPKKSKSADDSSTDIDQANCTGDIRRQVTKWQRSQSEPSLCHVRSNFTKGSRYYGLCM